MRIVPTQITNYNRTDAELQAFWLFCILVAGKNADTAAGVLGRMLQEVPEGSTPFEYLRSLGSIALRNSLVAHRAGQYARVTRAIEESLSLDLRTASIEDLEGIFGVGPKTARFFVLHSRPGVRVAVLDTHILKWLRDHHEFAPKSTPGRRQYAELERAFLRLADAYFPGVAIADVDLLIWCEVSGRLEGVPEPELPAEPIFDLKLEDHNTIFLLRPATSLGADWVESYINEGYQSFGNAIVVEHRYVKDIVDGAVDDGLAVDIR